MSGKARTPDAGVSKGTVAEEGADAPTEMAAAGSEATEGVATTGVPATDVVPAESASNGVADSGSTSDGPVVGAVANGKCDNHADRDAVLLVTSEQVPALAGEQRFCNRCVPVQYRYLLTST